ncbi:5-bromo-4-chloroindolyl phosphate hydrolysis protein [Clostridium punense]|uniref:5-bromo-4-chloroindolyl phosphate hydrolysis protein n=2 Tax=Clostridium TaxID=1485 RepID=A0ABS4K2N3_9CLOT|nr:5-bromo-4-chloroindolyl phosphate hydrolysis family protein [Clostridium punense]MBP2022045.1 5-bromo-4-chloroindolyl phosphate hydrolysis protein [Clostridium punense]
MNKWDFSNLGDEIWSTVQDALNTRDFTRLKDEIRFTAENTLNEVRNGFRPNYNDPRDRGNYTEQWFDKQQVMKTQNMVSTQIAKKPAGSVSGILYMVFGFIGTGVFGTTSLIYGIVNLALGTLTSINAIGFGTLFLLAFGSLSMALTGVKLRKRVKRFKKYVRQLRGRNYCSIKELASHIGETDKFVVKDLRKMIDLGMFPEGHIDNNENYLLLNYEIYEHYQRTQDEQKKQSEQEASKQREEAEKRNDPSQKELREAIEEGRRYIRKIREANDAIPGEEISRKLYRLEIITEKIFNYVEQHPEQLPALHKLMSYYLPITLKLVTGYEQLDAQPVQGENIMTAKREIEDTLDTISGAFEKLLDDLFRDIAFDISSDISVLETLLSQEGLTEKDFKK